VFSIAGIQESYDQDVKSGHITQSGWNSSASAMGRLGYKLTLQTGEIDNPVDMGRVSDKYLQCIDNLPFFV